ncbi:hypothetical protein Vadar_012059 [Vaccinium darrowii]|uniref:Uncharacterized protein n=1 Tax=Vaccinium darrowii TaxID=229202 RepID=A0ACB7YLN5_9ERIC|nr:hypothetical protein Vadar_012059 [Vaccinium darrowii]
MDARCYKCGKIGHYANRCLTKKKLNELQLDEGLRLQLSKLLLNTSDESDQGSSEEINELDYTTSSESDYSPPADCTGKCCSSHQDPLRVFANLNGLSLNVLSKSQQDILDLVDKVQDPEIRRKILELSLNSTISEAEPFEKPPNTTRYYSINEVFSHLEANGSKPATLQDLQKEVNELKSELKLLKTSQLEQHGSIVVVKQRLSSLEQLNLKPPESIIKTQEPEVPTYLNSIIWNLLTEEEVVAVTVAEENQDLSSMEEDELPSP